MELPPCRTFFFSCHKYWCLWLTNCYFLTRIHVKTSLLRVKTIFSIYISHEEKSTIPWESCSFFRVISISNHFVRPESKEQGQLWSNFCEVKGKKTIKISVRIHDTSKIRTWESTYMKYATTWRSYPLIFF